MGAKYLIRPGADIRTWMVALLGTVLLCLLVTGPAAAQDDPAPLRDGDLSDRTAPIATGSGDNDALQDILRRHRGEILDGDRQSPFSRGEAAPVGPDGTASGPLPGMAGRDVWEAVRHNASSARSAVGGPSVTTLVQDGGMAWLQFREGPLATYGGLLLVGMVALMVIFNLGMGRMRIEGRQSGRTLTRFIGVERFAHWRLSGSFLVLAVTGLVSLFGRKFLIPAFGHENFAAMASVSKWIHDNVSWAFMLALILVFAMWVWDNLPDRTDLAWIRQRGGFLSGHRPPAKKLDFGQKVVFWSVIVLGASISVSGLSLLFPDILPLFEPTFDKINATGLPALLGFGPIDMSLVPQEEMQLSQLWHSIAGFGLMAIIIGQIYIGSLGMEGAFSTMGSGEVEEEWAEQHHSTRAERRKAEERGCPGRGTMTPAE